MVGKHGFEMLFMERLLFLFREFGFINDTLWLEWGGKYSLCQFFVTSKGGTYMEVLPVFGS
jgi:hypothetical protein